MSYRLKLLSDTELVNSASILYTKKVDGTNFSAVAELQNLESGYYGSSTSIVCKICGQTRNCQCHYGVFQLPYPIPANTMIIDKLTRFIQLVCPICSRIPIDDHEERQILNTPLTDRINTIQDKIKKRPGVGFICPKCGNKSMLIEVEGSYPNIKFYMARQTISYRTQISPLAIHAILTEVDDQTCRLVGWNPETFHPKNFMTKYIVIIPNKFRQRNIDSSSSSVTSQYKNIIEIVLPQLVQLYRGTIGSRIIIQNSEEADRFNLYYTQLCAYHGLFLDMTKDTHTVSCLNSINKKDKKHIDQSTSMMGKIKGKHTSLFQQGIIGTRHNNSARTVLGGSPELACNKIGFPQKYCDMLGLFIPVYKENLDYIKKLVSGEIKDVNPIRLYKMSVEESVTIKKTNRNLLIEPGDKLYISTIPGTLVMYSRFPTIREESCSSFEIVPTKQPIMTIPLTTTTMKTADFDGDETQIYAPSSWYTDVESLLLHGVSRVARQYKDGNLVVYFTGDTNFELATITPDSMIGIESVFDENETCIERKACTPIRVLDMISSFFEKLKMNINYSDSKLEVINNKISNEKYTINNQQFFLYISTIYGMSKTLKLMNMIIQLGYNIAKYRPITMGNEIRFYGDSEPILKRKAETYERLKAIEQSNLSFKAKSIKQVLECEKQKVPVLEELMKAGKGTNIDRIGFLKKYSNEYYTNMINMDFAIVEGDRITPKLSEYNRTCASFPKWSIDPAAYGYIAHGYASPNIKPTESFYDCMVQRKSMFEKGCSISKQGYLSKRFNVTYGPSVVDCNGCVLFNDYLVSFNYGVDPRLKHVIPLPDVEADYSEFKDNTLISLQNRIKNSREVYKRLTSHINSEIIKDEICVGFDFEQWLKWNSEKGKTEDTIIEELCREINNICCPPKMIQCYGRMYNTLLEFYLRVKLRNVKINRDQAVDLYYHYVNSFCASGEPVGLKATLAISEAFTQAGLNSIHKASGGGVDTNKIERTEGLARFNELLGGNVHKNPVLTFGFINNTKEEATKFALEQETIHFCDIWDKAEIYLVSELSPKVTQMLKNVPGFPMDEFMSISKSSFYLTVEIELKKLADLNKKISDVINAIKTPETLLITGYVNEDDKFVMIWLFNSNVTKRYVTSMVNSWKTKSNSNIIRGRSLKNCYVVQNKNNGDWLVLANEIDPDHSYFEELIRHPAIDPSKCKTSNLKVTEKCFGICEADARVFEELYYTATNLSDTRNILERHYKTITDSVYADGEMLIATTNSIEKHDGDYLRRISFETPSKYIVKAVEQGVYKNTDDPIAGAMFNDLPRNGSGFSKVIIQ